MGLTVGQQVSGTGSGSGGNSAANSGTGSSTTPQIEVIGTNSYIVNTTVDDTEIGQIQDGDQVTITPTGSATPVYGTVGSISLIGSQSSNVTTFPVVVDVTGSPAGLYAGATADVGIIVKQLNNVTEVPTQAISYDSSGQATVTQVLNGAHVVKDVTVGAAENGETQITSGISPEQRSSSDRSPSGRREAARAVSSAATERKVSRVEEVGSSHETVGAVPSAVAARSPPTADEHDRHHSSTRHSPGRRPATRSLNSSA